VNADPDLGRLARIIGDPTRIRMLTLLLEGRALTAKELAHGTGVTPATATAHLHKLLADTLVVSVAQGRHKYFRFASPAVAHAIESLLAIAQPAAALPAARLPALHRARFCYDHLAGRVAIQLLASLVAQKRLRVSDREFTVTMSGRRWFASIGIETDKVADSRRRFACGCLDWSERRDHLGGALGAALAERCVASGWVRRQAGSRVATITPRGRVALQEHFGIAPD
jgi:DNA-binding transcriptional ArsR family regulator